MSIFFFIRQSYPQVMSKKVKRVNFTREKIMDGERSYEYEGVGLSANDVADIPKGAFPKEIYKENELSLCRGCAFLDRNCSAIPLTLFKDRDFKFYTSTCRGWKDKYKEKIDPEFKAQYLQEWKPEIDESILDDGRPKPLPLSSLGTPISYGGSKG